MSKPPLHFALVLGRIAHVRIGRHTRTLCGRSVGNHPTVQDLDAGEARHRADCRTCKAVIKPGSSTTSETAARLRERLDSWEGKR